MKCKQIYVHYIIFSLVVVSYSDANVKENRNILEVDRKVFLPEITLDELKNNQEKIVSKIDSNNKNDDVNRELAEIKRLVLKVNEQNLEIKREVVEVKKQNADLEKDILNVNDRVVELVIQNDEVKREVLNVNKELIDMKSHRAELKRELIKENKKLLEVENQYLEIIKEVLSGNIKLFELEGQNVEIKREVLNANRVLTEVRKQNEEVEREVTDITKQNAGILREFLNASKILTEVRKQNVELERKVAEVKKQNVEIKKEVINGNREIGESKSLSLEVSKEVTNIKSKITKKLISCQIPFVLVGKKCMFIGTEEMSYDKSVSYCRIMDAKLASPTNHELLAQFKSFINASKAKYNNYWVSATDRYHEGSWRWTDGSILDTKDKQYWMPDEPNNANSGEHCAIATTGRHLLFNDGECSTHHSPVCEYNVE